MIKSFFSQFYFEQTYFHRMKYFLLVAAVCSRYSPEMWRLLEDDKWRDIFYQITE